jgi:hypothetical protein
LADKTIAKILDITNLNGKKNPVPEPDPQLQQRSQEETKKSS